MNLNTVEITVIVHMKYIFSAIGIIASVDLGFDHHPIIIEFHFTRYFRVQNIKNSVCSVAEHSI